MCDLVPALPEFTFDLRLMYFRNSSKMGSHPPFRIAERSAIDQINFCVAASHRDSTCFASLAFLEDPCKCTERCLHQHRHLRISSRPGQDGQTLLRRRVFACTGALLGFANFAATSSPSQTSLRHLFQILAEIQDLVEFASHFGSGFFFFRIPSLRALVPKRCDASM